MAKKKGSSSGGGSKGMFDLSDFTLTLPDYCGLIITAMVFLYMWERTTTIGEVMVTPSHNVTDAADANVTTLYTYGIFDLSFLFFCVCAVVVVQDLFRDMFFSPIFKRLHLSNSDALVATLSGVHALFALTMVVFGWDIIKQESLYSIENLWKDYPHAHITFTTKLFYINAVAFWVHFFPVMLTYKYEKNTKKTIVMRAVPHIFLTAFLYLFNFTRLGVVLLTVRYLAEAAEALHATFCIINNTSTASAKTDEKKKWFKDEKHADPKKIEQVLGSVSKFTALASKLIVVGITIMACSMGLPQLTASEKEGDFNNALVRLALLGSVIAWEAGNFFSGVFNGGAEKAE